MQEKKKRIKGTFKQERAIKLLVENGGLGVSRAMIQAGYSPNTAHTPQKLTESQTFREKCAAAGLTDELILNAVREDIEKKPQRRVQELFLGAKIKGMLVDRAEIGLLQVNFDDAFKERDQK